VAFRRLRGTFGFILGIKRLNVTPCTVAHRHSVIYLEMEVIIIIIIIIKIQGVWER
jgi:hypothetical protein